MGTSSLFKSFAIALNFRTPNLSHDVPILILRITVSIILFTPPEFHVSIKYQRQFFLFNLNWTLLFISLYIYLIISDALFIILCNWFWQIYVQPYFSISVNFIAQLWSVNYLPSVKFISVSWIFAYNRHNKYFTIIHITLALLLLCFFSSGLAEVFAENLENSNTFLNNLWILSFFPPFS